MQYAISNMVKNRKTNLGKNILLGLAIFAVSILVINFLPDTLLAQSDKCGSGKTRTLVGFDIGCEGQGNAIYDYLKAIIRFLSAGVGIVVVLMIIVGGIRYITSSGNPEAAAGAKKMITNAVIALVLFMFMAAILNFLIPGGLL